MGWAKDHLEDLSTCGFGETGGRAVCLHCIIDAGLRRQAEYILGEPTCSFCGRQTQDGAPIAADFTELMRLVMDAIKFFYERSIDSLLVSDDVTPRYDSWDVAQNLCEGAVSDSVLEAIVEVIDHDEWNEDPSTLRPDMALRGAWNDFREKVKHESRFVFLSIPEAASDRPDELPLLKYSKDSPRSSPRAAR